MCAKPRMREHLVSRFKTASRSLFHSTSFGQHRLSVSAFVITQLLSKLSMAPGRADPAWAGISAPMATSTMPAMPLNQVFLIMTLRRRQRVHTRYDGSFSCKSPLSAGSGLWREKALLCRAVLSKLGTHLGQSWILLSNLNVHLLHKMSRQFSTKWIK